MSDILGQADKATTMLTNAAIASVRNAMMRRELEPNGTCHNCNELVDDPRKLFCDGDCASDHAQRQRVGIGR